MKIEHLNGLANLMATPQQIVVTNHVNPDGDAMGSALGLAGALKTMKHEIRVVVPNDYPEFLKWLPGAENVIDAEAQPEEAKLAIQSATVIFHLDYNAIHRAGGLEDLLKAATATRVLIDHHQQPEDWPDYIYSDTEMSSTSQMIFEWLEKFKWLHTINQDVAYCLYTGIVTDTGSFRFSSTTARTHHVAAQLLAKGVLPNVVFDNVFDSSSLGRLRLLGKMLDSLKYYEDQKAVLLHLGKNDLLRNNYQKGDSEGFVNYGLSIANTALSIFLREDKNVVKVSLRSKGSIDVNQLSRLYFNGGGHLQAAGGLLNMSLEEAIAHAEEIITTKL